MKIDWRSVSHIAAAIVGQVVPGVALAEEVAWKLGTHNGAAKQQNVIELVNATLTVVEGVTGKDLANNKNVDKATRAVIDAVVSLHEVVAHEAAAGV
jgi:hypothetical protein